jgi:glycosyltransferase involved in cell wall biosynthesis
MKIAIISYYLPSGSKIGVGYQVHHLANALVRRGHEVTVFSQSGRSADSLYEVRTAPAHRRLRTFRFAWDMRKIDLSPFDVLNSHGDDWFLWGRRRPRHVHTFHGSCLAEMIHSRTWTARARMAALAACELNSLLLADETVAVSENTRRYIPFIRHIVPCGVDTAAFRPGEKSSKPSLLFVGTMHGRKRGAMLLDVFRRRIRAELPEAELWCVCDRPSGETEGDGVQWLGRVSHERLIELYRQTWVFCLPSTYEGFGVPYVEAMASGTAVVATANPGAREVTGDGRWGMLCSEKDLGQSVLSVMRDGSRRRELERLGLERSREYSWEIVCSRYEQLYVSGEGLAKGVAL